MKFSSLIFVLFLKIYFISCQPQCDKFQTCSGCIGYAHEKCVWCSAKDFSGRRCQSKNSQDPSWCPEKDVYDPKDYVKTTLLDSNFADSKDNSKTVQFKPQLMKIKARTNVPVEINMSYKPAKGYPLDVYYLVDSSDTMKSYKDKLFKQALEIYEQLSVITNNVRLGVGSFIEKPALPYVDVTGQVSYSFRHHQKMTNDTNLFSKALEIVKNISGTNNDEPEAGFDALMQAMVCEEEIGWRPNSYRIILLSTDSPYHSAGDGKFVGAIKPNDMQCHLDNNNEYSMALAFDYPSVSQINKIATEKHIMIIFAADKKVKNDYDALEKKINNAKYVEIYGKSDVVQMIINEYKALASSVQIDVKTPPFMSLTFEPDCTKKDKCSYKLDNPVEIVGTLRIKSCPTDNKYNYNVSIGPVSINEKLTVQVEVDCQCDCEKPGQGEKDSDKCSKAGTYQCGICYCNPERHGEICNCNGTVTTTDDLEKCKANSDDLKSCSGRGDCRCGKCINCQKGFSGDFCEFDDNSCERPGGVLCSGHGKCTYGKCECEPNWLPTDCRCPNNNNSCIAPHSKEICSGRGECVCGQCVCNIAAEYCVGTFCDECEESAATRCLELQDYAYCNLNENKTFCDEKYNFTDTDVILVNKTAIYSHQWYMAKMWCRQVLEDGRKLVFRYHYPKSATSSTMRLIIQDEPDMPAVADVWVMVGGVIGGVLLIGIATIVAWKILVDLHDKREYEKFEKDSSRAGYDVSMNPLYHSPATNFLNPAYNNCN